MLNQAVYNLKVKGYLTSADLVKEAAEVLKNDGDSLGQSEFLKKELFAYLASEEA